MNLTRRTALALFALASAAAPAFATGGWDWDEEFTSRHWRTASLNYAQTIDPQHPSHAWIQANFNPPAHEMWCEQNAFPSATDVQIWNGLMNTWLHDYLEIPYNEALPQDLPPFPRECPRS